MLSRPSSRRTARGHEVTGDKDFAIMVTNSWAEKLIWLSFNYRHKDPGDGAA